MLLIISIIVYLAMFVSELECLNKSQCFIHVSTNREIIDSDLSELTLGINDEESSEGESLVLLQHTVRSADGHALVCQERYLHVPESTLLPTLVTPGEVGEVGVSTARDHLAVESRELSCPVIEGDDLRWTDEGEVERVEEEDDILALVIVQADLFELSLHNSGASELGSCHLRLKSHV